MKNKIYILDQQPEGLITDAQLVKIEDNSNVIPNPKQYKFLLSQSGGDDPQTATSGTLTKGVTYEIVTFETGDNFILSGAPNNTVGTKWISNGIAPSWGNVSSIGFNTGVSVITKEVTQNTLGKQFYINGTGNATNIFPIGGDFSSLPILELGAFNFDTGLDLSFISLAGLGVSGIGIITTTYTGAPANGVLLNTLVSITLYD